MLDQLHIAGGARLEGSVRISGAKNAALPILFAALLSEEPSELTNVPDLEDIAVTLRLLESLGVKTSHERLPGGGSVVRVEPSRIVNSEAPYRFVKQLRASFWLLGPLIARTGTARISLPGGDAIGSRPVDLHLRGLSQLGADVRLKNGVVYGSAPGGLHADRLHLDFPSVGATHQLMMTACLIDGVTEISGAACEPEVEELAEMLCLMGAEISGAGTSTIVVRGRKKLGGARYDIKADRIEAATYLIAGAATGGRVTAKGICPHKLRGVLEVLEAAGCSIVTAENSVSVNAPERLKAVSFDTAPYPGVATDVQPLLMAALARAEGTSRIEETVFENRFGHVAEFRRFGAQIALDGRTATIEGIDTLSGAPVEAGDIRAGAGLVIMALQSDGISQIGETLHLDRGYECFVEKFSKLGARISRIPVLESREVTVGC